MYDLGPTCTAQLLHIVFAWNCPYIYLPWFKSTNHEWHKTHQNLNITIDRTRGGAALSGAMKLAFPFMNGLVTNLSARFINLSERESILFHFQSFRIAICNSRRLRAFKKSPKRRNLTHRSNTSVLHCVECILVGVFFIEWNCNFYEWDFHSARQSSHLFTPCTYACVFD